MKNKTKKQILDIVMGILLQIYFFFPWIQTEIGRYNVHFYFGWVLKERNPLEIYRQTFLSGEMNLPENTDTIAVWFSVAVGILLLIQICELIHIFQSVRGKRFPFLQPLGWMVVCVISAMLLQFGMMNFTISDEQMIFVVPMSVWGYFVTFLVLDGFWYLAGKAAEQWDEASRRTKMEQEQRKEYRKERKRRLRFPGKYPHLYYRVLWKSFLHRWWSFSFLFFSVFISVLFLFIGISIRSIFADSYGEDQGLLGLGLVEIMWDFLIVLLLISFFLILGVLTFYRRKRAEDEGIFNTLGIRSNARTAAWIGELLAGFAAALLVGFAVGNVFLLLFREGMERSFPLFGDLGSPDGTDYLWTIVAVLVISLFAFGVSHDIEAERQSVDGRAAAVRSEKMPGKYRRHGLLLGLLVMLYCLDRYSQRRTVESMIVICIFCVGLYMCVYNIWGILLRRRKQNTEKYLKTLPGQHILLHRYQTTVRYIILLTVIHISVFFYFSMKMISNQMVTEPEENYPYDYVLLANSQDGKYLQAMEEQCGGVIQTFPMVRATTMDTTEELDAPNKISWQQGQNIGISESTYCALKELVGETPRKDLGLDAEGENIYVVYQQDQGTKAKPLDWYMMTKEPYVHIGQPLYAYNPYEYREYYLERHIVGEERNSLIGCFRQGRYENLIVFSDEYFEKVKESWKNTDMNTGDPVAAEEAIPEVTIHEGPTVLALINIQESYKEQANQILTEFRKAHEYDESLDPLVKSVYSKTEAVSRRQMECILEIVVNGFVLILLLVASILMLRMKVKMELPEMQVRYQFMECFGMHQKDKYQFMKKEVSRFVSTPLIMGMVISIVFTGILFVLRDFTVEDIRNYIVRGGSLWLCYLLVQIIDLKLIQRNLIRKIGK